MLKMLSLDNRGSFTVEAAVIIPFSLFVIAGIITLSFSLFNRCSLERAVIASALRGSEQLFESNNVRHQTSEAAFSEILQNNLLNAGEVRREIKVETDAVTVCAETDFKNWIFRTQSEKKIINPVQFIRKYRKIKGVVEKNDAGRIQTGGS